MDVMIVLTNAPGRSCYNRVERRMAPLSRDLAGVILPCNTFGSHLNEKGETVDIQLEKQNFQKAGEVLAEIWSETIIDSYATVAMYITPEESEMDQHEIVSQEWKAKHVRESHYCLQIMKCGDPLCCTPFRSSYFHVFTGFIPAPLYVTQKNGIKVTNDYDEEIKFSSLSLRMMLKDDHFKVGPINEIPFDICCPSLKELVPSRTCNCGLYHGTKKSLNEHQRVCKNGKNCRKGKEQQIHVRAKRIVLQRQQEKMVIWASNMNNTEELHVDWFDENDEEITDFKDNIENTNPQEQNLPLIKLDDYMSNAWVNDN